MNTAEAQRIVRDASPEWLAEHPLKPVVKMALMPPKPSGPTTLAELSAALQNPLPKPAPRPKCYNALEAMKNWKPLTLDMVRDLMAREAAAREQIIADYIARTGQQVALCEACELGVQEHEHDDGREVRTFTEPCDNCDGLGVVTI